MCNQSRMWNLGGEGMCKAEGFCFLFRSQGNHCMGLLWAGCAWEELTWWPFLQCWDKVDPDGFLKFCMRIAVHPVELSNLVLTFRLVFSLLCMKIVWCCWSFVGLLGSLCWKWSELVGTSWFLWNNREDKSIGKDNSSWERTYLIVQDKTVLDVLLPLRMAWGTTTAATEQATQTSS